MSDLVLDRPLRPLLELVEVRHTPPGQPLAPRLLGVTCGIDNRSITSVVGLAGAGRHALTRLITGLTLPDAGAIRLAGLRIDRLGPAARLELGINASRRQRPLHPGTVAQLLADARASLARRWWHQAFGRAVTPADRQDIAAILDFLEITPLADRTVAGLGGLEARLADLARCLAQRPRVLVLEHPLAGLVPEDRAALARCLERLREAELALVVVDDDLATLSSLADRCIVLHHGRLIADAPPPAIGRMPHVFRAITGSAL